MIKKEYNNALRGIAYREHDNRRQIFGQPIPESEIDRLVDAIHRQSNPAVGASILNTFVLQYNRNAAQQTAPAAIAPPEKPDMSNLKRIRQIKIAKARKFMHKDEPKDTGSEPV